MLNKRKREGKSYSTLNSHENQEKKRINTIYLHLDHVGKRNEYIFACTNKKEDGWEKICMPIHRHMMLCHTYVSAISMTPSTWWNWMNQRPQVEYGFLEVWQLGCAWIHIIQVANQKRNIDMRGDVHIFICLSQKTAKSMKSVPNGVEFWEILLPRLEIRESDLKQYPKFNELSNI